MNTNLKRSYCNIFIVLIMFQNDCPPWGKILTSAPVWAINIGHFGACWGYYTLFTEMPTFLKDILHFDIKHVSYLL